MKKRNRSITADLTPLLDVIFILLFLILIRNAQAVDAKAAEAEEAIAEAKARVTEAEALEQKVQGQIREYETLLADAEVYYIRILPEEDGRTIQLVQENSSESYHYDWDSIADADAYLQERIAEKASHAVEGKQVFLVFSYDIHGIYQQDYEMVSGALEAAGHRENVFVQYRPTDPDDKKGGEE